MLPRFRDKSTRCYSVFHLTTAIDTGREKHPWPEVLKNRQPTDTNRPFTMSTEEKRRKKNRVSNAPERPRIAVRERRRQGSQLKKEAQKHGATKKNSRDRQDSNGAQTTQMRECHTFRFRRPVSLYFCIYICIGLFLPLSLYCCFCINIYW